MMLQQRCVTRSMTGKQACDHGVGLRFGGYRPVQKFDLLQSRSWASVPAEMIAGFHSARVTHTDGHSRLIDMHVAPQIYERRVPLSGSRQLPFPRQNTAGLQGLVQERR